MGFLGVITMLMTTYIITSSKYRKISNIVPTKSHKLKVYRLGLQLVVFAQFIEAKFSVENEDIVGAAPTGDAPTTSE